MIIHKVYWPTNPAISNRWLDIAEIIGTINKACDVVMLWLHSKLGLVTRKIIFVPRWLVFLSRKKKCCAGLNCRNCKNQINNEMKGFAAPKEENTHCDQCVPLGSLSTRVFEPRKWAIFYINLPLHNHIHIAKYFFPIRDEWYKNMGDCRVLANVPKTCVLKLPNDVHAIMATTIPRS